MHVVDLVTFDACLVLILIFIPTPPIIAFRYQITLFLHMEMMESGSGTVLTFRHQLALVLT